MKEMLHIEFPDHASLECFARWLSEGGESDYFDWQGNQRGLPIRIGRFAYSEAGKFLPDNTVFAMREGANGE